MQPRESRGHMVDDLRPGSIARTSSRRDFNHTIVQPKRVVFLRFVIGITTRVHGACRQKKKEKDELFHNNSNVCPWAVIQ